MSSTRRVRAATVLAVVGLALAVAPPGYAELGQLGPLWLVGIWVLMLFVGVPMIIGWVVWRAPRATSLSSRPREDSYAIWSLILD